jgi:hypothetical protein
VTLTAYLAGKPSRVLIFRGIAKIEPPTPAGELEIVVSIPGPGPTSIPSAKENSFSGLNDPMFTPLL